MDRAALLALADRVEALRGPDREVDALISATARAGYGLEYQWAPKYPDWIAGKDGRVHLEKNGPSFAPPAYTASLDAAMAMVPSWACPRIFHNQDMLWECRLENGLGIPFKDYKGLAQTICLAILSAALRARASQ